MRKYIEELKNPRKLISRSQLIKNPKSIDSVSGLYGWYFKNFPVTIPKNDCIQFKGYHLLYIGISPDKIGKPKSRENLNTRIKYHYTGNAYGSTLRLSLGTLLTDESDFPLRRVGSEKPIRSKQRFTFTHLGEQWLDKWMESNAFVYFIEHKEPWNLEKILINEISLPLNIQGNKLHPFSKSLRKIRKDAKELAMQEPIANEDNQTRNSNKIYFD